VQKNGRPDVLRFAADHGYVSSYLYTWMGKTTPEYQNLRRLAADLRVELGWLGFGDDAREIPKTSVATHEKTPARPRRHRPRGWDAVPPWRDEPGPVVGAGSRCAL